MSLKKISKTSPDYKRHIICHYNNFKIEFFTESKISIKMFNKIFYTWCKHNIQNNEAFTPNTIAFINFITELSNGTVTLNQQLFRNK